MNPYLFNLLNGLLLFSLGLWSKSLHYEYGFYFILLGAVLIILSYFVRISHKIMGSIAMFSTFLSSILLGYLFYNSIGANNFVNTPLGMMLTSGLITSAAFIQCAMNHGSEQEAGCDKSLSKETNTTSTGCC